MGEREREIHFVGGAPLFSLPAELFKRVLGLSILNLFLDEGMKEAFVDGNSFEGIQSEGFVEEVLQLRHFPPDVVRQAFLAAGEEIRR